MLRIDSELVSDRRKRKTEHPDSIKRHDPLCVEWMEMEIDRSRSRSRSGAAKEATNDVKQPSRRGKKREGEIIIKRFSQLSNQFAL